MNRRGISKKVDDKELRAIIIGNDAVGRWVIVQVQESVKNEVTFTSDPVRVVVPIVQEGRRHLGHCSDRSIYAYLGSQFMPLIGLYLDVQLRKGHRNHFIATLANSLNLQVRQARHPAPLRGNS